jgi:predicted phage terminase large subunit-like protein
VSYPLLAYAVGQWDGYTPAPHHKLLAKKLTGVANGTIKRLIIQMPPRHGKSMLASEFFPAWYLGLNPSHQVITATYAQGLADDFGRKVRNLINSVAHCWFFPDSVMSDDSQAANRFNMAQRGAYFAVGAGGPITGRGADLLLIDDPIKGREDAESETMRQRLKDWYTGVARTRLMPGGAIVVIQTRWHDDDLAGWLQRDHAHEGWDVLNLPALAEPDDPLGREEGAALWPEAYPVEELAIIRQSVGSRDWSALYQQRPSAAEGSVFKRENWKYYTPTEHEPKSLISALGCFQVVQAWDTAFKKGSLNDYSVGVTIGISVNRYYVLDCWRDRLEFPDLKRAVMAQAAKWGAHAVLVEDAAAGQSLIQELGRNTRIPLIPVKADKDKVSRANAVTPTHEAGLCYLPNGAHWLSDFVDEMAGFPSAPHDDQVDAWVHGMAWAMQANPPEVPVVDDEEYFGRASGMGWMG